MTNVSYYDDIKLVKDLLEYKKEFEEKNEILFEMFKGLEEVYNNFEDILKVGIPTDISFIKAYNFLTNMYINLENVMSKYERKYKITVDNRRMIKKFEYYFLDPKSSLVKNRITLSDSGITPESITHLNKLILDSKTIGFRLDVEDKNVLNSFKLILNNIQ